MGSSLNSRVAGVVVITSRNSMADILPRLHAGAFRRSVRERMRTVTVTENTPFIPEDDTFHTASDDPYWTETTWWSLNIPERRMGAWLHAGLPHQPRRGDLAGLPVGPDRIATPAGSPTTRTAPTSPCRPAPICATSQFPGGGFSVKMLNPLMDYHVAYQDADADFARGVRAPQRASAAAVHPGRGAGHAQSPP